MIGISVMDTYEPPEGGVLPLMGGLDGYQKLIRDEVLRVTKDWSAEDIEKFDSWLRENNNNTGALALGLRGVKAGAADKPFTRANIELVEGSLMISVLRKLQPLLEPHLTKGKPGAPLGLIPDESGEGLDLRSEEFLFMGITAMQEAEDAIADREAEQG